MHHKRLLLARPNGMTPHHSGESLPPVSPNVLMTPVLDVNISAVFASRYYDKVTWLSVDDLPASVTVAETRGDQT